MVYFTTSLKSNELVMERTLRGKIIKLYEDDEDILEDAITENKQAIEMAKIYNDTVQYGLIFTRYTIETTIPNTDALKQQIENLSDLFSFGEYEY